MLGCAVMIQPHLREQAHANIVTGLWLGLRIYLSEKGIDYKHFKEIGCNVYSIEKDLNSNNTNILLPLSDEEVEYNRSILLRLYGKENVQRNIQRILQKLN
jgi:phosphoenolpyruvate synthase/pyruvate phosphate dikinase